MTEPAFLLRSPLLPLIFLFGGAILTIFSTCLLLLGRFKAKEVLRSRNKLFFFHYIFIRFFPKHEWENLNFTLSFTKHILHLLYATSGFFYALSFFSLASHPFKQDLFEFILIALVVVIISIVLESIMRLFATAFTKPLLKLSSFLTSVYLLVFFPLSGPLLKIIRFFFRVVHAEEQPETVAIVKDRIKEMIRDSELGPYLDPSEQKLITSMITFRERVAKEIMVPRIDMISLPSDTSLREAAQIFVKEGYSRIPIYKETLDHIVGVLLYKDILRLYAESSAKTGETDPLDTPIEIMAKPVIYTPENKKISQLLQEFRNKQLHLAIVVDEYGGTEGIVTIEDILEELVGDIEDEYDFAEDRQFWKLPNGSWIVDAKMSIIDIESKLGIHIPPHPEYETIGGYIYHRAGTIPSKGWTIHHDEFELVVLSSSDRSIEKIRITPSPKEEESSL